MEKERRKHTRYKLTNAVAINSEGIYQLVDISEGGFCFKCHPYTSLHELWVTDIINSVARLSEFASENVWVSLCESGKCDLPNLMLVGIKFSKLTKEQKLKLKKIIKSVS